jgi:hypothetical protein
MNVELPNLNVPHEEEQDNPLLSTIKIPRNFSQLTKALPK